jgi:hypothetical protein
MQETLFPNRDDVDKDDDDDRSFISGKYLIQAAFNLIIKLLNI